MRATGTGTMVLKAQTTVPVPMAWYQPIVHRAFPFPRFSVLVFYSPIAIGTGPQTRPPDKIAITKID